MIAPTVMALVVFILCPAAAAEDPGLKPPTEHAWDAYLRNVDAITEERCSGQRAFLWVDESAERKQAVRRGEIVVADQGPHHIPGGMIHHWIGTMFVRNAGLEQAMAVVLDFSRYSEIYKPFVAKSEVLGKSGDDERIRLLLVQKAFSITAAFQTDDEIRVIKPGADKACITSKSFRVEEIADYGRPNQHAYAEDKRPGYVWHTAGVTRLEQRDGGVYVEMEVLALSRGIPWALRWLVKPLTEKLPRRVMMDNLKATRDAVRKAPGHAD